MLNRIESIPYPCPKLELSTRMEATWAVMPSIQKGFKVKILSSSQVLSFKIQIAVILVVLIRMTSVISAENGNTVSTYDPNKVAKARQDCLGDTCCSEPFEIVQMAFWSFAKSSYSCCVPKGQRNKRNCCPHPLIPSMELNVDPSFGPFCCDPETGHCCSKLYIKINKEPADYVFTEPVGGKCCATYDPDPTFQAQAQAQCCPRPLFAVRKVDTNLAPSGYRYFFCCSNPMVCSSLNLHYDAVPTPRSCSPRGFCCPWPYTPLIRFDGTRIQNIPQFDPQYDNQCSSPADKVCTLPQVPSYKSCIEQQFSIEVSLQDSPLYDEILPEYSNPDSSRTVTSSKPQCLRNHVFRRSYGNPVLSPDSHSVAVDWFVTSPYVQRSKLLNQSFIREKIWMWPDVIVPFIFPITIATSSVVTILPALLLGAIGWAVVFNFRFLWHKKVRMAIRRILVCIEKRQRIIEDNYIPPEDQRKFHARDRYQLPKSLQDSDRSEDDEPEDLKREHTDVVESNWTAEEIHALGFDPDNIPVDWIYGDLLGNPSALRKEVRIYNSTAKASGRPILCEDDDRMKQLGFDEWLHFLDKGRTSTQVGGTTKQRANLEKKWSIQRHKAHKRRTKRTRIRVTIKPSDTLNESSSTEKISKGKKKKIQKSESSKKTKSRRRKGTEK